MVREIYAITAEEMINGITSKRTGFFSALPQKAGRSPLRSADK
jgi:hypothetical protein